MRKVKCFLVAVVMLVVFIGLSMPAQSEETPIVIDLIGLENSSVKLGFVESEPLFPEENYASANFLDNYYPNFLTSLENEISKVIDAHGSDLLNKEIIAVGMSWGYPDNFNLTVAINNSGSIELFSYYDQATLPQFENFSILRVDYGETFKNETEYEDAFLHFIASVSILPSEIPSEFQVKPHINITESGVDVHTSAEIKGELDVKVRPGVTITVKGDRKDLYVGLEVDLIKLFCRKHTEEKEKPTFKKDETPPVTECDKVPPNPNGENGWYLSDVKLEFSSTDPPPNAAGVKFTEYKIIGDFPTIKGIGESYTIKEEGHITIKYRSGDKAGNLENWHTDNVKIDKTKPTAEPEPKKQKVEVNENANFDGSKSHDKRPDEKQGSGIEGYEWYFGDGSTGSGVTKSHAYNKEGTYTVTLKVWDKAGNDGTGTAQADVQVEVIPEFTTIAIPVAAILGLLFLFSRRRKKEE